MTFNSVNTNKHPGAGSNVAVFCRPGFFYALLIGLSFFMFAACKSGDDHKKGRPCVHGHCHGHGDGEGDNEFVSIDSADKMLSSYLASINYPRNDSDLHSVIINADTLRAYLADTTIKDVKIMLAHTLSYINNGGGGKPCGYDARDLTFIIAGYNRANNYVYYMTTMPVTRMVIDHGMPCPTTCPPSGSAANNILE